jgi:nicotinamidase-related amidase
MLPRNTALVVIDVQKAFDNPAWGTRNNPEAERNIARLLEAWRAAGRPIFHVKHDSADPASTLRAGTVGNEIKEEAKPRTNEPVITKNVNSAFIGTDLEKRLRDRGITALVLVGLTTDHCVSTTARMAGNLGFDCYVVGDATATFSRRSPFGKLFDAQVMHETSLASLHEEFAKVVDTSSLLRMLA